MQEIFKEERNSNLIKELVAVWEDSVRATHYFLKEEAISEIKKYVPIALKEVSHLTLEYNEQKEVIAFMGINDKKLEMLFVKDAYRRKGIGKKLLAHAIKDYGVKELTVNEDNPEARTFYEHMGFKVYRRTDLDEEGNPYPLLYMKLCD